MTETTEAAGTRLRTAALEAAHLIAERVTDRATIARALEHAQEQTRFPLTVRWSPYSVAQGDAGQALLCSCLARAFPDDERWVARGRDFLHRALTSAREQRVTIAGTASGLAGLALAADLADLADRADLTTPRAELDALIHRSAFATIAELHGRRGVPASTFDVISGLSGTVLHQLPLTRDDGSERRAGLALPYVLRALSTLALADGELPAWYTPREFLYDEDQMRQYPHGHLNCGLAHGAPGILAALALAVRAGHGGEEERRAVETLGAWVADQGGPPDAPRWPVAIPVESYGRAGEGGVGDGRLLITRDAWCYGTPGVARALWLAGDALDRPDWRDRAVAAMAGVYERPVEQRQIDSPTFCHGVAGLLQITLRFGADTGLPMFADAAAALVAQILAVVDAGRLLGVANVEPGGGLVDQPGILDGASGVCLTLLGVGADVVPAWDRIFALA